MIETLHDAPAPFQRTEIHTLPNGMKLILKDDPTVPVVALQAWARCGAIDESPELSGISHGLEHMVFKGTPTRSAGEITEKIEFHGGAINAATQLETTHYYIDIPSYGAPAALEVLADTILNPTFPQEELERERLVILEEIHRRDDNPGATLWDEFVAHVFKGTPYGIKVIGNEKTVSSLSRQDLLSYYRKHYVPANLTLVVTGEFHRAKMLKRLERLFGSQKFETVPPTPAFAPQTTWAPAGKPGAISVKKPVQLTYYALGIPTVGLGHPDVVALDLLSDVMGGGLSSRLYQKLREETELALSVSCDYTPFQQKGLFSVFGESLPAKAAPAVEKILEEIDGFRQHPIQKPELERAKARIKSEWLHGSETPHDQAETLGSLSVLGNIDLVATYLPRIEALTVEDLMETYDRTLRGKNFFITKVEPH